MEGYLGMGDSLFPDGVKGVVEGGVGAEDGGAVGYGGVGGEGEGGAGLLGDESGGGEIPLVEAVFEESVGAAGGDLAEVEGGGSVHADFAGLFG